MVIFLIFLIIIFVCCDLYHGWMVKTYLWYHGFLNVNVFLFGFSPWSAHSSSHPRSSPGHHLYSCFQLVTHKNSPIKIVAFWLRIRRSELMASEWKKEGETFVSVWDLTVLPPFNWARFTAALDFIRVRVRSLLKHNHFTESCLLQLDFVCVFKVETFIKLPQQRDFHLQSRDSCLRSSLNIMGLRWCQQYGDQPRNRCGSRFPLLVQEESLLPSLLLSHQHRVVVQSHGIVLQRVRLPVDHSL